MKVQRDFVWAGIAMAWATVCVGWLARSNARLEQQLQALAATVSAKQATPTIREAHPPGFDPDVLRVEVRRAFADMGAAVTCDCAQPVAERKTERGEPAEEPPHLSGPEAIAAFEGANELVDQALVRTTWTEQDREQLHHFAGRMDPQSFGELLGRLARSVNDGKLTPLGRIF
jgi:hypothetical protein